MAAPKKYRTCINCSYLNTPTYFKENGCLNCKILSSGRENDFYLDCTSNKYKGMVAMFDPEKSWVAKWQRINDKKPGLYSLTVEGVLPDDYINVLYDSGKKYYQRDNSFNI